LFVPPNSSPFSNSVFALATWFAISLWIPSPWIKTSTDGSYLFVPVHKMISVLAKGNTRTIIYRRDMNGMHGHFLKRDEVSWIKACHSYNHCFTFWPWKVYQINYFTYMRVGEQEWISQKCLGGLPTTLSSVWNSVAWSSNHRNDNEVVNKGRYHTHHSTSSSHPVARMPCMQSARSINLHCNGMEFTPRNVVNNVTRMYQEWIQLLDFQNEQHVAKRYRANCRVNTIEPFFTGSINCRVHSLKYALTRMLEYIYSTS